MIFLRLALLYLLGLGATAGGASDVARPVQTSSIPAESCGVPNPAEATPRRTRILGTRVDFPGGVVALVGHATVETLTRRGAPPSYCIRARLSVPVGNSVLIKGHPAALDRNGIVELHFPFQGDASVVHAQLIGAAGQVVDGRLIFVGGFADRMGSRAPVAKKVVRKRNHLRMGLGITAATYVETGARANTYSAWVVSGILDYLRHLDARGDWGLQLSGYGTLLHLSESDADQARYLGLNGRFIRRFFPSSRKWNLSLAAGAYFLTMLVPSERFGYVNLAGPQLYPALSFSPWGFLQTGIFVKYSPVQKNFGLLNSSNREWAAGISLSSPRVLQGRAALEYNFADIQLELSGVDISNQIHSLGFSFRF